MVFAGLLVVLGLSMLWGVGLCFVLGLRVYHLGFRALAPGSSGVHETLCGLQGSLSASTFSLVFGALAVSGFWNLRHRSKRGVVPKLIPNAFKRPSRRHRICKLSKHV